MKIKPKTIWKFIVEVFEKFIDDKAPKLGAALSFYTIFSLAPLLIIAISVAGAIFGKDAARGELVGQIEGLIGEEGAKLIQIALKNAQYREHGFIPIIVSVVTLIIGSTVVFVDLQESLDMVWKVKAKPGRNLIKGLLKDRLRSFTLVIGTGFLLLVSLIVSAVISAFNDYISEQFFALPVFYLNLSNLFISLLVTFLLFMMIFRILPDVHIEWRHVWVGALVTAVLFVLGKYLIGLYLGTSSLSSTYGAAGSLVILLLWVYYSSQILFLGAEFTQVYLNRYSTGIHPTSKFMKYHDQGVVAEKVDKESKANQ
jgi:membrane protein